jgi:hypothetical protein
MWPACCACGVVWGEGALVEERFEGAVFRVSSRGIDVTGVIVPHEESDARCASLALSHLSLSLSLFA